jgi:hypothetical protein
MGKNPGPYSEQAMVTLCTLRDDVTSSEAPTGALQQLVPQSSDPFLGLMGGEDATQQHTSPEQTEDDEPQGEQRVINIPNVGLLTDFHLNVSYKEYKLETSYSFHNLALNLKNRRTQS